MSFNNEIDAARIPRHVAIIMDGNGRWAKAKGLPRTAGHQEGVETVKKITEEAVRLGQILDFIYVLHRKLESSGTRDCGTHGVDSRPS